MLKEWIKLEEEKKINIFNDNAVLGELENILNEEKKVEEEEEKE